jgi:hypothetical protein
MSISADGYFSWMLRHDATGQVPQIAGPLTKTNGGINTCKIVVPHSAEGYWPYLGNLLQDPTRRASWMFSNLKDGRCFQHYSIYAQVWGSGSGYPNNNGVMWETEGVAGEPLTDKQNDNNIRIIREVSALKGWKLSRPTSPTDKDATGYEHNECVRWGSTYTACPSGRIPWDLYLAALNGEEDMTALVWCHDLGRLYIVGSMPAQWVTQPDQVTLLKKIWGEPKVAMSYAELQVLGAK